MAVGREPGRVGHVETDDRGGGGGVAFVPVPAGQYRPDDVEHAFDPSAVSVAVDVEPEVAEVDFEPEGRVVGDVGQRPRDAGHPVGRVAEEVGDHSGLERRRVRVVRHRQAEEGHVQHAGQQAHVPALVQRRLDRAEKAHAGQGEAVRVGRCGKARLGRREAGRADLFGARLGGGGQGGEGEAKADGEGAHGRRRKDLWANDPPQKENARRLASIR